MINASPFNHLLQLLIVATTAGPPAPAATWREMESAGDRWDGEARPIYQKCLDAWSQVERFATRVEDRYSLDLARRARAGIILTLRDVKAYQTLIAAGPLPRTIPPLAFSAAAAATASPTTGTAGKPCRIPSEDELKELTRFLTQAGRNFFELKEKEDRDLPLLFEALAFSYRLLGDLYQSRGDAEYTSALAAVDAESRQGAAGPAGAKTGLAEMGAAGIRLRYKLRDFSGAQESILAARINDSELRGKDRVSYLQMARDLARFRGDNDRVMALNQQLLQLGSKAEENPPPLAPFASFIGGKAIELARMSRIIINVLASSNLSRREHLLAIFISAAATLEAGEPAMAAQILDQAAGIRSAPDPRPQDGAWDASASPWLDIRLAITSAEARERMGDYEGSLSSYEKAAALLAGITHTQSIGARVDLNRAAVLMRAGRLDAAKELAGALLDRSGLQPELKARARMLLGDFNYFTAATSEENERQMVGDALSAYRLAAKEMQANPIPDAKAAAELRAQTYLHIGNAQRRQALRSNAPAEAARLRQEAIQSADVARRTALEYGLEKLASVAAANLGELQLESGDLESARQHAAWALQKAEEQHNFECEWRARWYLGRIADARGESAAAQAEFDRAASLIETFRLQILGPLLKSGFMSTKRAFYESLLQRSLRLGDSQGAFFAAERARARAFVESLGLKFLLLANLKDQELYHEYIHLLGRLEDPEAQPGSVLATFKRDSRDYEDLRRQLRELAASIRSNPGVSSLVKSLVDGAPSDAPGVQRGLRDGEILIEYASTGESLVAFLVSRNSFDAVDLRVTPAQAQRMVREYLDRNAGDADLAGKLHQALIAPLAGKIQAIAGGPAAVPAVIVVPWGPLFRLPMETLREGRTYLLEKWRIAYLPSASLLRYLPRDPENSPPPTRLVAFVDPDTDYNGDGKPDFPRLSFAHDEIAGIAPFFKDKLILEGSDAQEEAYSRVSAQGEVFHFACHGEFFPTRPLDSSLYLAKSQGADGRFRASEIFAIDFRGSRLITLSGCETGRLEIYAGDDPVGIGTSLLHSGARALLASLWKVEDEATASLMQEFYRSWLGSGGSGRAQALRQAKLTLLRQGKFTAPRQWAAFILVGID